MSLLVPTAQAPLSAIQETIFITHRFRGSHLGCFLCQFVGLPDVFQGFAMLEDQSRVKIIIGRGQQSLGEQFI
jgi:hypothetical protein